MKRSIRYGLVDERKKLLINGIFLPRTEEKSALGKKSLEIGNKHMYWILSDLLECRAVVNMVRTALLGVIIGLKLHVTHCYFNHHLIGNQTY